MVNVDFEIPVQPCFEIVKLIEKSLFGVSLSK